jgi:CopG family nickel-responsive transcriptional regulator
MMRTSFNIPDDLLSKFDETWQAEELNSRSRGVREAMQEYIEGHTRLEDVEGDVVVIIAFDYEHEAVIEDIHDVQHQFQNVITTTNHLHEGEWCLETLFCSGAAPRVRDLTYRLRDFEAVSRVKLLLLTER